MLINILMEKKSNFVSEEEEGVGSIVMWEVASGCIFSAEFQKVYTKKNS